ncbi:MAG TPA: DNA gyrase subunit A [Lentisphaeria bacterium]|nr:DNA gyrase subunit A [Lentisphaeria bacterium]HCG48552.1 DNA gyrase subunit A [Lentisphaeria bacterium]
MSDNVIEKRDFPVNIEDIMHTAYLQYSLSVNVGRAIPDVRDGLKPCNRRILYAMRQLGLMKSRPHMKSARVVGEVIGKYHPHGDSSVYDTLVRMAQDFSMRMPLIDGQGNFGSIDGDPPAAYRYTECRMERFTEELLSDIDKDTVNMIPTFDENTTEPEVLPAKFPNLLVNGSMGIGVGMATNIPPHNLGEVIDATIHLLENPSASVRDLMKFLPGPDFPTGAIICGLDPIRSLYETGHGVIKVRAKAEIIEQNGKEIIIVKEIPYAVNKEMMVKKIAELVKDKKITGISDLRDETSLRTGIRIVIEIKRGAMASVVLNQLYAHTQMESILGCQLLVVDHNRPRTMNLAQILQAFVDHRLEVVTRRTQFELNKAEARAHIVNGLLIAVQNIDEVVKIIRESRTREEAGAALMARFGLSKIQVAAILDMRLHQLTGLAIEDLQKEYDELMKLIEYLRSLLASRELRLGVIKDELADVRNRYADPRRTEITYDEGDINYADLIPRHSCVITVSNTGYIKRVPADTYRTQHRGGVGIIGMETKDEDHVEHLFNADSHDLIFFFTDRGFMYWLNVYDIPEGARTGKGKAIVNLIKIEPGEQIRAMLTLKKDMFEQENLSIVMATKRGVIKKTALKEFRHLRNLGLRAIVIEEGDDLIGAEIADGASEIILSTAKGMACRFVETDVRTMGRATRGVTGIRFKLADDEIVSMEVVPASGAVSELPEVDEAAVEAEEPAEAAETEPAETADGEDVASDEEEIVDDGRPQLLVVTSGGMGKRSYVDHYRLTRRGAKGVKNLNLRPGEVVIAALRVKHGDELILTTERGQVSRIPVDEIRIVGRASMGVRIMDLRKGDKVTGATIVVEVEANENPTAGDEENVMVAAGVDQIPFGKKDDDFEEMEVPPEDVNEDANTDVPNEADETKTEE